MTRARGDEEVNTEHEHETQTPGDSVTRAMKKEPGYKFSRRPASSGGGKSLE